MMKALHNKDIWAGLLFVSLGLTGCLLSLRYPLGTASRMGPGYVPLVIAIGMTGFGAIIAGGGIMQLVRQPAPARDERSRWNPRPLLSVLCGILLFGVLIQPAGLIVAGLALLLCGSAALKGQRLGEVLLLAFILISVTALIFVYGIGVRISLLPNVPVLPWN